MNASAIGFRVKTGWASAVVVGATKRQTCGPEVADARVVWLADPESAELRQPYHARFGTLEEDPRRIEERLRLIRETAASSIEELFKAYSGMGFEPRAASLVVGSLIEPERIANQHMRAHALEGRLFRSVLAEGLEARGVRVRLLRDKEAYAEGASLIGVPQPDLERRVREMGRGRRPWRAKEKLAALAAWVALTST